MKDVKSDKCDKVMTCSDNGLSNWLSPRQAPAFLEVAASSTNSFLGEAQCHAASLPKLVQNRAHLEAE